jgi:hypothetical protein
MHVFLLQRWPFVLINLHLTHSTVILFSQTPKDNLETAITKLPAAKPFPDSDSTLKTVLAKVFDHPEKSFEISGRGF